MQWKSEDDRQFRVFLDTGEVNKLILGRKTITKFIVKDKVISMGIKFRIINCFSSANVQFES